MKSLPFLGDVARVARQSGLGMPLQVTRDLIDGVCLRLGRPPLVLHSEGLEFHGFLRHRSFLDDLSRNKYEELSRQVFLDALSPGMTVVDAGAHIGLYAMLAAKCVGPTGRVLAFEPDPHNFRALSFNVARNGLRNVTPIRKAISNEQGRVQFNSYDNTISGSLFGRTGVGKSRVVLVESTTIDGEVPADRNGAMLIKLDVEGAEPLALTGARRTLKTSGSVRVIFETNAYALQDAGLNIQTSIAELQRMGFEVFTLDEAQGRLIPYNPGMSKKKCNLYCVKNG